MLAFFLLLLGSAADQAHTPSAIELQQQAARQQRDAIRQQLGVKVEEQGSGEFEFLTPPTLKPQVDCAPIDSTAVDSLIEAAAKKQSLEIKLLRAVMRQESGFKPCAVSTRGAQGLMQIMPDTAAELHVSDPFDPQQNVEAGAAYLKQMLKKYNNDLKLALGCPLFARIGN